jgi:hypothetical protein
MLATQRSRKAAFAEESAEVEVLAANLEKSKALTKKIQGSLNRLETSGQTMKEAIGPMYSDTQKLQTMNSSTYPEAGFWWLVADAPQTLTRSSPRSNVYESRSTNVIAKSASYPRGRSRLG